MESLRNTYDILLKERVSTIRRGLLDTIDTRARLIAIKGSRGVGKTNFLLDFAREYHAGDPDCLYVNINNLFFATEGLFHFAERFHKLGGKTLLLACEEGCAEEALAMSAMLSVEKVFVAIPPRQMGSERAQRVVRRQKRLSSELGDHFTYLNV